MNFQFGVRQVSRSPVSAEFRSACSGDCGVLLFERIVPHVMDPGCVYTRSRSRSVVKDAYLIFMPLGEEFLWLFA